MPRPTSPPSPQRRRPRLVPERTNLCLAHAACGDLGAHAEAAAAALAASPEPEETLHRLRERCLEAGWLEALHRLESWAESARWLEADARITPAASSA